MSDARRMRSGPTPPAQAQTSPTPRHTSAAVPGPLLQLWGAEASEAALTNALTTAGLPVPTAGTTAWAAVDAATLEAVRTTAQGQRLDPWPRPPASHYARYFRDGDRDDYQDALFACQARLSRSVLLAAAQTDGARTDVALADEAPLHHSAQGSMWLDEAIDGVAVLCELTSWCWPAHEIFCAEAGTVVPDPDRPFLDLGAGEIASQLAWADHVLGRRLDERAPGLRALVRHEVRHRVLDPFLHHDDWHWLGLDGRVHNWCPWICSNVIAAALVFATDDAHRARLVAKAIEGIDRFLAALPDDGAIDEGFEYWWNGAGRALEGLDLVRHATGGALDAAGLPVVQNTVRFPHRMHLGGHWYLNLADARARQRGDQPWFLLHRWARRVGDDAARSHAAAHRVPGRPVADVTAGLGRMLTALHDREWTSVTPGEYPLEPTVWLPGIEVGIARRQRGTSAGLALAVKGGHNDENHNHNDVGSVVVAVDGVPALIDAGRPTYTAQTFGPDRYDIWTMQSSWHNVPEVSGTPQAQGADRRAADVRVTDEPERFAVELDLAAAYPVPLLENWWRTAELDRPAQRVTVHDHWHFTGDPPHDRPTTVRYLLAGRVDLAEPGHVTVRPLDGARPVRLTWDPDRAVGTATVRELDDPMLSDVWGDHVTRLDLQVPVTVHGTLTLTVEVAA